MQWGEQIKPQKILWQDYVCIKQVYRQKWECRFVIILVILVESNSKSAGVVPTLQAEVATQIQFVLVIEWEVIIIPTPEVIIIIVPFEFLL